MDSGPSESRTPAYVSFVTFKSFVEKLNTTVVPGRIDSTLMNNHSGATQSQLLGALRFFSLINGGGQVTAELKRLVSAVGTPDWKEAVEETMLPAYGPILGDLDIGKATPKELRERFTENTTAEGSVLVKAIRFYLKTLEEAEQSYSPHFGRTRQARGATRRSPAKRARRAEPPAPTNGDGMCQGASGQISFPIHLRGKPSGAIVVPKNFDESDCEMLDAIVTMVKIYAKQNAAQQVSPAGAQLAEDDNDSN